MPLIMRMLAVGGRAPGDPGPMVPNYGDQAVGRRTYHGRRLDHTQGTLFQSRELAKGANGKYSAVEVTRRNAVFVPTEDPVFEVPETSRYAPEYVRHLRDGDLLPADQATATFAGVRFDPTFERSLLRKHAEWLAELAKAVRPEVASKQVAADVLAALGKPVTADTAAGGGK